MSYINSVSVGGSTYNLRDEEAIHDVSNLATKAEVNGKLDSSALNNYMTTEQVNNALANKADSSALSDYMTTEQVNNALQDKVSASQLDNFATLESLNTKAYKNELNNYATKEDLNNVSGGGSNVNMFVEGTTLVLNVSSGGSGGGSGEAIMAEFAVSSTTTNDQGHQVVALEGLTNLYNNEQKRQELQSNTFSFKWVDSNGTDRGQNGQFNLASSATEEFPAGPGNEKMVINWTAGTLTFINTGFPEGVVKVVLIKHSNGGGGGQPNFTDVYTTNITNVSRPDSTKYVYTVDDSGFANMISTMASYSPDHWNGAFRDSHGSQWGFGEFSIIAATSSADGFDGYKATGPDGVILAFNTADNTITFNQSADATELQNAAVFVLRRVL